jgi:hypothetical protein
MFGPVDRNAGFFIPLTNMVREGYIPSVDFWNPYTPGSYYLYALLGERGLHSPLVCKLFTHLVLLIFGLTLFATLRTLGHRAALAAFFASAFSVWIYSLGGWALLNIDVLQSMLVLVAFLCLCRWPTRRGAMLAGLVAGCALMVKQYAVLSIPWLALLALLGDVRDETDSARATSTRDWLRPVLFLAVVGTPFLTFVAAARGNPIDLAIYFATWSGQASNHGWAHGVDAIVKNLTGNSATTMISSASLMLAALLVQRRSSFYLVLAGLFLAGVFPSLVREFSGYSVYAAPWVIIICATFAREMSVYFSDRSFATTVLTLLACLPLAQVAVWGTMLQARTAFTNPAARQFELAQILTDAVPTHDNVLVINKWWIYALTDFHAPLRDYNQLDTQNLNAMRPTRDAAEYIVYVRDDKSALAHDAVLAWIAEPALFAPYQELSSHGESIVIFARTRAAPTTSPESTDISQPAATDEKPR